MEPILVFEDAEVPEKNRTIPDRQRQPHEPTEEQRAALNFIANHPHATPNEIARAAGYRTVAKAGGHLGRLIDNGWVQVTVSLTDDGSSWR